MLEDVGFNPKTEARLELTLLFVFVKVTMISSRHNFALHVFPHLKLVGSWLLDFSHGNLDI